MKGIADPTLDFVDWLGALVQQFRAIGSLLCHCGHPMSEDDCHQLSALIEHLTEDLEQETNKFYKRWKEAR